MPIKYGSCSLATIGGGNQVCGKCFGFGSSGTSQNHQPNLHSNWETLHVAAACRTKLTRIRYTRKNSYFEISITVCIKGKLAY